MRDAKYDKNLNSPKFILVNSHIPFDSRKLIPKISLFPNSLQFLTLLSRLIFGFPFNYRSATSYLEAKNYVGLARSADSVFRVRRFISMQLIT